MRIDGGRLNSIATGAGLHQALLVAWGNGIYFGGACFDPVNA
jgi:hypothetical protein